MKADSSIVIKAEEAVGYVSSCSECSKQYIDGKLNIKGLLHRELYKTSWGLNCVQCPVHLKSVETGEFDRVLAEIDGTS